MSGRILAGAIVMIALLAGVALYYTQVFAYYDEVSADGVDDVALVSLVSGLPEPILYEDFQAVDKRSSPIGYRACFTTSHSLAMLSETFEAYEHTPPRVAPGWFDCFDAEQIDAEVTAGTALMFLSQKNIAYGVDRVVAITDDGRGYVWHELNECGDKAYDGTVVGEECPAREETN
ncbi:DUF6446 family protein [Marinovum sp. 2_MG-2023]|uniref:DUF6446 family protein n=1 Tax=unclassified Marinovum TaxID=2647166 RepID=UPI0026E13545|nr:MULTISPECIES: DUF6446 family protein [unclassified Marinovum]MDO6729544.1 DUF6446 family protein [Marinovum sp. 2_MG-2023]MDO6780302.1 DUF6446 family protein [Marinovum sp. 1_MG-2023]